MNSSRTFVAVELGDSATAALYRVVQKLKGEIHGVRWSRREQLHITLKFLGDIDNRELPELCTRLRQACTDVEPFTVTLQGLGSFPKGKPPRVVWAAVQEGAEPMQQLHQRLDQQLQEFGIPGEGRGFTPHITLGRVGRDCNTDRLEEVLAANQEQVNLRFDVNEAVLLASIKDQGSIIYEPIDIVELQ